MDEKAIDVNKMRLYEFLKHQCFEWYLHEESLIDFATRIYHAGCAAQSEADKDAMIVYMDSCHKDNPSGRFLCPSGYELMQAIAAAAIMEKP